MVGPRPRLALRRTPLDHVEFRRVGSLRAVDGDGASAFQNADAEQAIEIVLEPGTDERIAHLPERLDGRGIGRGSRITVYQIALQSHVLPE